MNDILSLIGRKNTLFDSDLSTYNQELYEIINNSTFLIIGGAGSIGQAVSKEIFRRNPKKLHIVDLSENNMVELIRDLRSSFGYIDGEFKSFALDIGSVAYDAFIKSDGQYDYILNLSALKHVRSEKDPFTLMRMIDVNIFNTDKTLQQAILNKTKKYFCVSTDKAANPVNMMGASKRIMEMFLMRRSTNINLSTARFANVAFSDGSLLHGFNQRIQKKQPIVAPIDIKRYFITPQESGELCLMSCIFAQNREIFFPKLDDRLHLISFADIAKKYLNRQGYSPYICETEQEARDKVKTLPSKGQWPCLFSKSDTTGEKSFEEFYTTSETIDLDKYQNIGVIKYKPNFDNALLNAFEKNITQMKNCLSWDKATIVDEFKNLLPNFDHFDTGKNLDGKM